eukprot:symbB.v1.2.021708.t1/scaffold1892.1/size96974/5
MALWGDRAKATFLAAYNSKRHEVEAPTISLPIAASPKAKGNSARSLTAASSARSAGWPGSARLNSSRPVESARGVYTLVRSDVDDDEKRPKGTAMPLMPKSDTGTRMRLFEHAGLGFSDVAEEASDGLEWVESNWFQGLSGMIIMCNAVVIGLETDLESNIWFWVEHALLAYFLFELVVRLLRHGHHFFRNEDELGWNIFDLSIVASGVADQWVMPVLHTVMQHNVKNRKQGMASVFMVFRMARLLRIVRLFRLVKIVRPLYELAQSITEALQGVGLQGMNCPNAPHMERMGSDATPYAGLFPDGGGDPPIMTDVIIENHKRLATYHWAVTKPKGLVVLVHGFGEHLGRYFHVANFFVKQGYEVRGMDHVCHGHSEGFRHAYGLLELEVLLESWTQYILQEIVSLQGPHFVYSHSTGGMVAFLSLNRALLTKWDKLVGVIYSAPLIRQPSFIAKPMYWCPGLADCCLSCGLLCGTCCLLNGVVAGQLSTYKALEEATRKDPLYFGWKAASSTKSFETDAFASCEHEIHNEEDWQKPLKIALQFLQSLKPADRL